MTLLEEALATRSDLAASRPPRCGVARFVRRSRIDADELDALYTDFTNDEIHALLVKKGYDLGVESVKRHSPLRGSARCSCRSPRS